MAFNAGAVKASLELETKGFTSSIKRAGGSLNRLGKRTRDASSANRRFTGSFVRMAAKVGAGIGVFLALRSAIRGISAAVQVSAEFEQLEVRLGTLLGSQEEANKALQSFIELSAKTPFAVKEIAAGAATLSAAALGNREELELLTKTAVNLSAATGLSFEQTASNLQRALSAGIASADLFRDRGITPMIEAIADIPDLTEVSLEELRQAFIDTFGPNGTLGDSAEKLSLTLGGALSNVGDAFTNLQDAVGDTFAPAIVGGVTEVFVPALEKLLEIVVDNDEILKTFAAETLSLTVRTLVFFARAGIAVIKVFSQVRQVIRGFEVGLLRLRLQLIENSEVFQQVLGAFGINLPEVTGDVELLRKQLALMEQEGVDAARDIETFKDSLDKLDDTLAGVSESVKRTDFSKFGIEKFEFPDFDGAGDDIEGASDETQTWLEHLREVNGVSLEAGNAAKAIADETGRAASNTAALASAAQGADAALKGAASSAAATARGGRRSGGSLGLTGGTAQQTAGNLRALQQNLGKVGGLFGRAQRQSGRAVVNQLRGVLEGQIAQQTQEFTSEIISELNRQGIFDPERRQQIVQQRIDEAKRLGVIASAPSSIGSFTGA